MGRSSDEKLGKIKKLYYEDRLCMREIAEKLQVSIDTIVSLMRKNNLERRSFSEINKLRFEKKIPSFKIRIEKSDFNEQLKAIGAMLYWGEGYRGEKNCTVDFTNSDPEMISLFLYYLRNIYELNENKFRILLYCYSDQNIEQLINFWSKLTQIPKNNFSKPYIRKNFNKKNCRKMQYGLVHVRYFDKKLLIEIKSTIDHYKKKYICRGMGSGQTQRSVKPMSFDFVGSNPTPGKSSR